MAAEGITSPPFQPGGRRSDLAGLTSPSRSSASAGVRSTASSSAGSTATVGGQEYESICHTLLSLAMIDLSQENKTTSTPYMAPSSRRVGPQFLGRRLSEVHSRLHDSLHGFFALRSLWLKCKPKDPGSKVSLGDFLRALDPNLQSKLKECLTDRRNAFALPPHHSSKNWSKFELRLAKARRAKQRHSCLPPEDRLDPDNLQSRLSGKEALPFVSLGSCETANADFDILGSADRALGDICSKLCTVVERDDGSSYELLTVPGTDEQPLSSPADLAREMLAVVLLFLERDNCKTDALDIDDLLGRALKETPSDGWHAEAVLSSSPPTEPADDVDGVSAASLPDVEGPELGSDAGSSFAAASEEVCSSFSSHAGPLSASFLGDESQWRLLEDTKQSYIIGEATSEASHTLGKLLQLEYRLRLMLAHRLCILLLPDCTKHPSEQDLTKIEARVRDPDALVSTITADLGCAILCTPSVDVVRDLCTSAPYLDEFWQSLKLVRWMSARGRLLHMQAAPTSKAKLITTVRQRDAIKVQEAEAKQKESEDKRKESEAKHQAQVQLLRAEVEALKAALAAQQSLG